MASWQRAVSAVSALAGVCVEAVQIAETPERPEQRKTYVVANHDQMAASEPVRRPRVRPRLLVRTRQRVTHGFTATGTRSDPRDDLRKWF